MTVGALAIFSTTPVWIIKAWQFLQLVPTLLVTLVPIAMISLWGLAILVDTITWVARIKIDHGKLPSCCQSSWFKRINSIGLYLTKKVGRALCPLLFPRLFTEHKMRAQAQTSLPEVYIAFLNRNLNDHLAFLLVFSLLSIVILAASGTAFLTSFSPVPTEAQCLEEDKFGHSLICYTDNSAYPENCRNLTNHVHTEVNVAWWFRSISQPPAVYDTEGSDHSKHYTNSTTEDSDYCSNPNISFYAFILRTDNVSSDYPDNYTNSTNLTDTTVTYTCYPWTIRTFGVAFASAMGVFKFAIFFTTAYVQIGDWCLRNCSTPCKIGKIFKWIVMIGLSLSGVICLLQAFYSFGDIMIDNPTDIMSYFPSDVALQLLTKISELCEYTYLPVWLCLGLAVVTWYLEEHCKQAEFNTLSPDQLPPPPSLLPQ